MFEVEYKNKYQLNEIKKKMESIINTKIKQIRYNYEPFLEDTEYISGVTEGNIGFWFIAYKDKGLLDKEIEGICKSILEKQNSIK